MRTLVRFLNPLYFLLNAKIQLARKGSFVSTGQKNELRTCKTDGVVGGTGDMTRNKCIELIYDGLACDATARTYRGFHRCPAYDLFLAIDHVVAKARAVEAAVYKTMSGTTAEYRNKIRSLFVNLKDKANPSLRASIVEGSLTPEKFTKMSSQV